MKKAVYLPLPFFICSYKFTKVKSAPDFVRDIQSFHFGEKRFCRNDFWDKVLKYCTYVGVHIEYSHYFDKKEGTYQNACNMTTLENRFKKKIMTTRGKGRSSCTTEQRKQKEEAAKKKEEEARRLVQEAEKLVVEEAQRKKEEEEQR